MEADAQSVEGLGVEVGAIAGQTRFLACKNDGVDAAVDGVAYAHQRRPQDAPALGPSAISHKIVLAHQAFSRCAGGAILKPKIQALKSCVGLLDAEEDEIHDHEFVGSGYGDCLVGVDGVGGHIDDSCTGLIVWHSYLENCQHARTIEITGIVIFLIDAKIIRSSYKLVGEGGLV